MTVYPHIDNRLINHSQSFGVTKVSNVLSALHYFSKADSQHSNDYEISLLNK